MKRIRRSRARHAAAFTVLALVAAGLASGLSGCLSQNPYPAQGIISTSPPDQRKAPPVYFIDAPQSVDFQEGQSGGFTVASRVPAGLTPVLSASGLPSGATFDPVSGKFSWSPGPNAGHDPSDPTVFEKHYEVQFELRTNEDPLTVGYTTQVELVVQGLPQPMSFQLTPGVLDVQEGQPLNATIQVVSHDFPKGPFDLQISPLPDGAVITPSDTDPSVFNLTFTPGYDFVTSSDTVDGNGQYIRPLQLTIGAIGPRAQRVQKTVSLAVHDVRQAPLVSVGDNLTFSYAAEFAVYAEDLNGEEAPSITVRPPAFGTVQVTNGPPGSDQTKRRAHRANPNQVYVVRWTAIPGNQVNQPLQLVIDSCVNGTPSVPDCTTKTVHMTFIGQEHAAPSFDRTAWVRGTTQYLRLGSSAQPISLPISDPDDTATPTVTVEPASMQSEVSYRPGSITLTPQSMGIKIFELVATSSFGVQSHESFTYRVLPQNWGSMLLLGQSTQDAEIQATLPLLPDSQILNPALESVDADQLVLRNALFLTTDAIESGLLPAALGSLYTTATSTLGHVIVSTPLIAKLPHPVLPDDLTLAGRFNDLQIANKPKLSAMSLVPTTGSVFTASQKPVKLSQSLTAESANPMILGVSPNGACTVVMSLATDTVSLPIAVDCTLTGGAHALFTGFEWGDVALDPADNGLTGKWLQAWLGGAAHGFARSRRFQ